MPTTSRFGLRYPAATDPDNPPQDLGFLAADADGWLSRAFVCTSTTRPTGVPTGFLIFESDTGALWVWDGDSWAIPTNLAAPGGGGGGGGSTVAAVSASWQASSAQPIAANQDVTVAFGTAIGTPDGAVTRAPSGAGHAFTLTRAWTITGTIRYAQDAVGGRIVTLETLSGQRLSRASAPPNAGAPWSTPLAAARRLTSGTQVRVITRHNSTTDPLTLDPDGGDSVQINFVGV